MYRNNTILRKLPALLRRSLPWMLALLVLVLVLQLGLLFAGGLLEDWVSETTGIRMQISGLRMGLDGALHIRQLSLPEGFTLHGIRIRPRGIPDIRSLGQLVPRNSTQGLQAATRYLDEPWILLRQLADARLLPRLFEVESLEFANADLRILSRYQPARKRFMLEISEQSSANSGNSAPHTEIRLLFVSQIDESRAEAEISLSTALFADVRELPGIQIGARVLMSAGRQHRLQGNLAFSSLSIPGLEGSSYRGSLDFSALLSFTRDPGPIKPYHEVYPETLMPRGQLVLEQGLLRLEAENYGSSASTSGSGAHEPSLPFQPDASISVVEASLSGMISGLVPPVWNDPEAAFVHRTVPAYLELKMEAEDQALDGLWALIPDEFAGGLANTRLEGRLNGSARLRLLPHRLQHAELDIDHQIEDFGVSSIPYLPDPRRLNEAFYFPIRFGGPVTSQYLEVPAYLFPGEDWMLRHSEHSLAWVRDQQQLYLTARLAAGPAADPAILPESARRLNYLRLNEISDYMISALLSAEDGDFFFHEGMDWKNIAAALERSLIRGEIAGGASTLSMQLVKNLYLSADQALSRKFEEAVLVYLIEEIMHLPKDRILELYLNLVEFGPDIYGIDAASSYYFGISASELDISQSVWLASVLPSPKSYHGYYEAGAISDGWFEWMRYHMDIMHERGRISTEEYRRASASKPEFAFRPVQETP